MLVGDERSCTPRESKRSISPQSLNRIFFATQTIVEVVHNHSLRKSQLVDRVFVELFDTEVKEYLGLYRSLCHRRKVYTYKLLASKNKTLLIWRYALLILNLRLCIVLGLMFTARLYI